MNIRNIERRDVAGVVALMREFAELEKLGDYCTITEEKLANAIFDERAFVQSLVIDGGGDGLLGYAIFYPHFASFRGQKGFYLEDIYVRDTLRGRGAGRLMLQRIARLAADNGFERIDFQVLDWNVNAIRFYTRLGAERDNTERHFKFTDSAFTELAAAG